VTLIQRNGLALDQIQTLVIYNSLSLLLKKIYLDKNVLERNNSKESINRRRSKQLGTSKYLWKQFINLDKVDRKRSTSSLYKKRDSYDSRQKGIFLLHNMLL